MCSCKQIKESVDNLHTEYECIDVRWDEPSFSHYGCESCADSLAGDVYLCALLNKDMEQVVLYLCADCIYAFEYGYLDCIENNCSMSKEDWSK